MGKKFSFNRVALMFIAILFIASSENVSALVIPDGPIVDGGDFCWNMKITETKDGAVASSTPMLTKVHVSPLDLFTYILTGTIAVPGDNPAIFNGTASFISTKIIGNLSVTQDHKTGNLFRDAGLTRITIDPITLKGTFFSIEQSFDRTNHAFDTPGYYSGILTPRPCP